MPEKIAWVLCVLFSLGALESLVCFFAVLDGHANKPSDPPDPVTDEWNARRNDWTVFFMAFFTVFLFGIMVLGLFIKIASHSVSF